MSASTLNDEGFEIVPALLDAPTCQQLAKHAFVAGAAGTRCLLDQPEVRSVAIQVRKALSAVSRLSAGAVAIQAIAFDKTPVANWKVTWHQDLMFPLRRPATAPGYELRTVKDGVDYARPPAAVLAELLAVRLHIDLCDETNGPLRVSPGTHLGGILPSSQISAAVAAQGEQTCLAQPGDALLMRPLLLHASSPARLPKHRRVLHLVYHDGPPPLEPWYRAV